MLKLTHLESESEMRSIISRTVFALVLLVPSLSTAVPMRYDVNGTLFDGGGLSGYFTYDVSIGDDQNGEYNFILERATSFSLFGSLPLANDGTSFGAAQKFGFTSVSISFIGFDLFNCLPNQSCLSGLPLGLVGVSDFTPGLFTSPDITGFTTLSITRGAAVQIPEPTSMALLFVGVAAGAIFVLRSSRLKRAAV